MNERDPKSHEPVTTEWIYVCERCGERMEERQCKIICGNCGTSRDCSDP